MNINEAKSLLEKYNNGKATKAEVALLKYWFLHEATQQESELSDEEYQQVHTMTWKLIAEQIQAPVVKRLWLRYAAIAAAVATVTLGVWLYYNSAPQATLPRHPELVSKSPDFAPGGNRATLTVNGKQMQLSDAMTGVIVGHDKVTYNNGSAIAEAANKPLTITTPRGGTYQVTLSDGTKVWLNADSKLEFLPNFWNQVQRIVRLSGEGYFEVAKDKLHPFIVQSNGQRVTVLGTHFNISAYQGEAIKTTLIEGSVRVSSLRGGTTRQSQTLKSNQQAINTGTTINVTEVNAENAIAWRNGYFMFNDEPLENILPKIARWYNVQITYESPEVKKLKFFGTVSRFENASKVLEKLELTDKVRFEISGQQIKVFKKHP